MHETMDFIFRTLNRHDNNFTVIRKIMRSQHKFNSGVVVLSFAIAGITFLQETRIRSLEQEIEKMKESQGVEK